jgi:hypothetical protein
MSFNSDCTACGNPNRPSERPVPRQQQEARGQLRSQDSVLAMLLAQQFAQEDADAAAAAAGSRGSGGMGAASAVEHVVGRLGPDSSGAADASRGRGAASTVVRPRVIGRLVPDSSVAGDGGGGDKGVEGGGGGRGGGGGVGSDDGGGGGVEVYDLVSPRLPASPAVGQLSRSEKQVAEIVKVCSSIGEQFVDSDFVPGERLLSQYQ